MYELEIHEIEQVNGGLMYIGLSWYALAFMGGYAVGDYIDKHYIAPLW